MIEVKNLTKKFDDYTALDSVTCSIPEGCIYGMVGSNGAGKSTFLRLISGVYRPDGGEIRIDGEPVYENTKIKNEIAYVPDELFFLSNASIERMADLYHAVYKDFSVERCRSLTEAFKLNYTQNTATFSKGMRRQAAIILAISCRPKYLFLDETFDGLDPVMRSLVKSLIMKDVAERNATAILTSHSLRELEDTCDQLSLLHKGGLVFESDIMNLKTSLYKVQIAFTRSYDKDLFEGVDILHYEKTGSVAGLIVRGDREETVARLKALEPAILDVLPLTLEEVFTYEMSALGYEFDITQFEGEEA